MVPWPAAIVPLPKYVRADDDQFCPAEVADDFMLAFRIRLTSIKVSAVVTEITEPNKIISIPALSMSFPPKHRQFPLRQIHLQVPK
jgi:hypothetical protein